MPDSYEEPRLLLWEMIKDTRYAMFTTRHRSGHLHSRPMTTQNTTVDEDDSLWFFMSRKGDPFADLAVDPVVNVTYSNPGHDGYVSVSGTAKLVEDTAKKKQLWNKSAEAWFAGGAADPDLALVQVRITHANYWDAKKSKVVELWKRARAALGCEPPHEGGAHGVVRMN